MSREHNDTLNAHNNNTDTRQRVPATAKSGTSFIDMLPIRLRSRKKERLPRCTCRGTECSNWRLIAENACLGTARSHSTPCDALHLRRQHLASKSAAQSSCRHASTVSVHNCKRCVIAIRCRSVSFKAIYCVYIQCVPLTASVHLTVYQHVQTSV